MNRLIVAIIFGLCSVSASGETGPEPCIDGGVSATGIYINQADEDYYLSDDDC